MRSEAAQRGTAAWIDEENAVFARVLNPYRAKSSLYLRRASITGAEGVVADGEFSITESCYIDDTGHFNAAEFVICYNQLMYTALAVAVERGLLPELAEWTLDEFWDRQLPDVLIHKLDSSYSRPINARAFSGQFTITSVNSRALSRGMLTLDTAVRFWDSDGGKAHGSVALVLVNVPERTRTGSS